MLDIPLTEKPTKVKTLDEQLEEAIENEDYEIAANIRDAIKKEKKIKKKS
jgi:protein-arginine kinase activator protein McsA